MTSETIEHLNNQQLNKLIKEIETMYVKLLIIRDQKQKNENDEYLEKEYGKCSCNGKCNVRLVSVAKPEITLCGCGRYARHMP